MKTLHFGIEMEMTGITREKAANLMAGFFGTGRGTYEGRAYDTYTALDNQGRTWKAMSDSSIRPQRKVGGQIEGATRDYRTEVVSPILSYDDIPKLQKLVRTLRKALAQDGDALEPGTLIARITGCARSVLTGERLALNLLQHLSGIATRTHRLAELARPYGTRVVDTRKTTPGLRLLEKYAVRTGGGHNHRLGLYDAILIKDNHIAVAGGVKEALARAQAYASHMTKIEIEVESLAQAREAVEGGADVIMLDNMAPEAMKECVEMIQHRTVVEASGGIDEHNLEAAAAAGVDVISIGALTHSVKALDISLDVGEIK